MRFIECIEAVTNDDLDRGCVDGAIGTCKILL